MDGQVGRSNRKRRADSESDYHHGSQRVKNSHELGERRPNVRMQESPLIDTELQAQEPMQAISADAVFNYYREHELAKETECNSEEDSSNEEFEVVISSDPIAGRSMQLPSPIADNKNRHAEGGADNDDDGDEFEEAMRRGFAEDAKRSTRSPRIQTQASIQRMSHSMNPTPEEVLS
jgi:hypothetical protein